MQNGQDYEFETEFQFSKTDFFEKSVDPFQPPVDKFDYFYPFIFTISSKGRTGFSSLKIFLWKKNQVRLMNLLIALQISFTILNLDGKLGNLAAFKAFTFNENITFAYVCVRAMKLHGGAACGVHH